MAHQKTADLIRDCARRLYVEPAREAGKTAFDIIARDIHTKLQLNGQYANVCQSLQGQRFCDENGLALENIDGPPSLKGAWVTHTYRFVGAPAIEQRSNGVESLLHGLRGIAKDVFRIAGGSETFIRSERNSFDQQGHKG